MNKLSLLILILIGISAAASCSVHAVANSKMDTDLREALENAGPSDLVGIIIVFQEKPTEERINTLETVHGMEITHVYVIINGVAGKAPAKEIPNIAEYNWVKEIWLDKKVYATENKTVETSELVEGFQIENDELRQTIAGLEQEISGLKEQVQEQHIEVSQLELNLKVYSVISFIAGLMVGVSGILLVKQKSRALKPL